MKNKCIFCKTNSVTHYSFHEDSKSIKREILICNICQVLFPSVRMESHEVEKYIQNEIYGFKPYTKNDFSAAISKDYYALRSINKPTKLKSKSLDIGAHIGGFVHNMRKLGYEAMGIDIYANAVNYATQMGEDVRELSFTEDYKSISGNKNYSFISFMESIYYFNDPKQVLKIARKLLEKDGILFIQTINGCSRYFSKNTYFSRYGDNVQFIPTYISMKNWLTELDFEIVSIKPFPRYSINQLFKYRRHGKSMVRSIGLILNYLDYFNSTFIQKCDKILIVAKKVDK